jgi:apolipoprotein D and lipocalin family protein
MKQNSLKSVCCFQIIFLPLLFSACSGGHKLQTVEKVDIDKYAGKWYEIANYPPRFQKGCSCTTAEYAITGKRFIRVTNECKVGNKFKKISGKAFIIRGSNNAKLKVRFFWPFSGKYWIIDLDDNYQWAVVSNPSRKYLWILSRKPSMENDTFIEIIARIKNQGFDTSKLVMTKQDCSN